MITRTQLRPVAARRHDEMMGHASAAIYDENQSIKEANDANSELQSAVARSRGAGNFNE